MSRRVVLCLNGVEFTPPGAGEPVCWPWERTSVGASGITVLDESGDIQTFGPDDGGLLLVGDTKARVARRLHARKRRKRIEDGLTIVIDPKTFRRVSWWVPLACGLVCTFMLALEWTVLTGTTSAGKGYALAVMSFLLAALLTRTRLTHNVAAMTLTADGMNVQLHDGRSVHVPWSEFESKKTGCWRTVNGLEIRPAWSPQLRQALVACRAVRPGSLGRYRRRLSVWFWIGVAVLVLGVTTLMMMLSRAISFGGPDALIRFVLGTACYAAVLPMVLRFKMCFDHTFSRGTRLRVWSPAPAWTGHQAPDRATAATADAR